MKSAVVFTNGCPENRNDCAMMEELLRLNGWMVNRDVDNSSLILFNACGLTKGQEEKSLRIIEYLSSHKKTDSKIIVWGCLTKINPVRLKTVYNGPTFGSDDVTKISEVIDLEKKPTAVHANYLTQYPALPSFKNGKKHSLYSLLDPMNLLRKILEPRYRQLGDKVNLFTTDSFVIKTSTGCMSNCSYCAVKNSRGKVRSKSIEKIAAEFEAGLGRGFTDFSLIGTDVGSYGLDKGIMLTDLLEELTKHSGKYQIRIRNIQPKFLIKMLPDMKRIFGRKKISYIGATAQSGSNRILKSMKRGYDIENYKNCIKELKKASPELKIRNQLMVGFPGETEEDFQQTLNLLDDIQFDHVELFIFQSRIGTFAAEMSGQIPENIAKNRYNRLFFKVLRSSPCREHFLFLNENLGLGPIFAHR